MKRTHIILSLGAGLISVAGAALVLAGPLDPPTGAIAPTYKTLSDVEPRIPMSQATTPGDNITVFRIAQPGSYYLTGDLCVSEIARGIEIAAAPVTIDLNGFRIYGGEEPGSCGIYASQPFLRGVTIRNGEIYGFEDNGINLAAASVREGEIERIRCHDNIGHGIWVGASFRITQCTSTGNYGDGFRTGRNSIVSECTASGNIGSAGFTVDDGSVISSSVANTNQNVGFSLDSGVALDRSSAFGNTTGVVAGDNAVITACTAYDNRASGIVAQNGSSITACTARANGAIGIDTINECTVSGCTATSNGSHGIAADHDTHIINNTCTRNGASPAGTGAGIYVTGAACRIDSNHVVANDYGVRTTMADTLVVRNTARGNTLAPYSFAVPTESAQIITNPGANFVSTNPRANFAY